MTQFSHYFLSGFNFFFIFVFLAFLAIKKIIPSYKKQIREEQDHIMQQAVFTQNLIKKKNELVSTNAEQKASLELLEQKVSDWYKAVEAEEEQKIKLIHQRKTALHEKQEILHEQIIIKKIQTEALKKALALVENEIKSKFETDQEQEAYLKDICLCNSKKVFNA